MSDTPTPTATEVRIRALAEGLTTTAQNHADELNMLVELSQNAENPEYQPKTVGELFGNGDTLKHKVT